MCAYVCVRDRERKGEKERESVCVLERESEYVIELLISPKTEI